MVDDNRHMRALLGEVLRSLGAQVDFATKGAEALERLSKTLFDIVLADLSMTPVDGVELIRGIRALPNSPNAMLPIIMLTSQATPSHIAAARDAGVTEILSKPLVVRQLLERLHAVVHHPRVFIRTDSYFGPDRRRRTAAGYAGPRRRLEDGVLE